MAILVQQRRRTGQDGVHLALRLLQRRLALLHRRFQPRLLRLLHARALHFQLALELRLEARLLAHQLGAQPGLQASFLHGFQAPFLLPWPTDCA